MLITCDTSVADAYTSKSQQSRIISETWFSSFGYCLACESNRLCATAPNTRANDFLCPECGQGYELKTYHTRPRRTLVDGAYTAMISRVLREGAPTLMLLERSESWNITSLTAIHGRFLTPDVIVKRKPLSPTARRSGWVGCNIRLDLIVSDAKIPIILNGLATEPNAVRRTFRRFERLGSIGASARGWATLTLRIIRELQSEEFSLSTLYEKEADFAAIYPNNQNIRAKIRQQLQVLRDLGYLEFCGRGKYHLMV